MGGTGEVGNAFAEGETVLLCPGLRVPDWSLVADPAARAALAAAMAVSGRRERWAGLDGDEHRLWQAVLRGFAATGRAPPIAALAAASGIATRSVPGRLESLRRRDLVVLAEDGRVAAAYPFCERRTPHRVMFAAPGGAPEVFALCAIDALGIGAMLGRATVVASTCAECARAVRIATGARGRALDRVDPEGAAVWSGIRYAGGCAATSGCAVKLFFCSAEHLDAWRTRTEPDGAGFRLTIGAALQVGAALFGPMLRHAGRARRALRRVPLRGSRRFGAAP